MVMQPSGPAVEFRNVSKAFGKNQVLKEISESVAQGETGSLSGLPGRERALSCAR